MLMTAADNRESLRTRNRRVFANGRRVETAVEQGLARLGDAIQVAWGIHDTAAPVGVADYAWKTALESRTADFWLMRAAITTSSTINLANSQTSFAWSLRASHRPGPRIFPQSRVSRYWQPATNRNLTRSF